MVMSLNKVMLIGNVGRDPEVRYLEGGSQSGANAKVATFTLATTERYRDRNGELRENTEWHNIVAWRNSADVAEKFVKKGTQLYIEGKLRTRSYTDSQGAKKYTTEIVVDNLQLLSRRQDQEGEQQGGWQQPSQPSYQQGGYQARSTQQDIPAGFQPRSEQPSFQQPAYPQPQTPAGAADDSSDDLPF